MWLLPTILSLFALSHFSTASLLGKVVKEHTQATSCGKLSILHKPHPVEFVEGAGAIPFDEISSIFSLALGFSVHKDLKWHGLLSGNPFSRPKALVTFSVDNVPMGKSLKVAASNSFQIVANEHLPFENLLALGERNSLANHVSSYFEQHSLTVSVAASEEVASSGHSGSESGAVAFLDLRDGNWRHFVGSEESEIMQDTLDKVLPDFFAEHSIDNIRLIRSGSKISLKTPDTSAEFDLSKQEVKAFFNELSTIVLMAHKALSKRNLITDGTTDVFSFFVTTLQGLEHVYGAESTQTRTALSLVDEIVKQLEKSFKKAYDGNVLIAAIAINQERSAYSEDQVNSVYKKLKGKLAELSYDNFHKHFPSLHLLQDVEEKAKHKLCEGVQGILSAIGGDLKFKCANDKEDRIRYRHKRSLLAVKDGSNAAKDATGTKDDLNLGSFYDEDFPVIFNIWFWLMVILVLSVYLISLVMWFMDPGKDSIIYRMTSQHIKTE